MWQVLRVLRVFWKRLFQRDRLLRFFNDLLKTRVAAQRVSYAKPL
jgi:hypothetical protein